MLWSHWVKIKRHCEASAGERGCLFFSRCVLISLCAMGRTYDGQQTMYMVEFRADYVLFRCTGLTSAKSSSLGNTVDGCHACLAGIARTSCI